MVHPAAGNQTGTLVNALLHHCKELSGIGGVERPGIESHFDPDLLKSFEGFLTTGSRGVNVPSQTGV